MSRSATSLDKPALTLLLAALESPLPVLSAAILKRHAAEAASLKAAGLIQQAEHELSSTSIDDHSDSPVSLSWLPKKGGYGYFSEATGWVPVPQGDLASFSIDVMKFTGSLTRKLQIRPNPPVVVVQNHLWEVGSTHLGKRSKPTPIMFGRRLNDPAVWSEVQAALQNRPSLQRRILLTSTRSNVLPDPPAGCALVSIADLVQPGGTLEIDPALLALRLDHVPTSDPNTAIQVIAGGREVRFLGETFRFPRGLRQRDIVNLLYQHSLKGEFWVSSAKIVDQLELDPRTRIRDIFKRHVAWNRLLTERGGMCGFCFPDKK